MLDRVAAATKSRQYGEHRCIGCVVANKYRQATGKRCNRHQPADRGTLGNRSWLELDDRLTLQHFKFARVSASNERGERSLVLTYPKGSRPGIYRFVAGRLTSIERAPDAAPTKPEHGTRKRQAPS